VGLDWGGGIRTPLGYAHVAEVGWARAQCPPMAMPVQTRSNSEKSRLYSTESADSTSKTDDRLNRSTQLSPTVSTQLDSNVKRSTRSIDSIDFGV